MPAVLRFSSRAVLVKEIIMSRCQSRRVRRAALVALAALMTVGLTACGSTGSSPSGPSEITPRPTGTTVVFSQTLANVEAGEQRLFHFSLPDRGGLALTVTWNDPDNTVLATLTSDACANVRNPDARCPSQQIEGRAGKGKEAAGSIDDPDAGGAYFLLVQNLGPGPESISVTASLTTAASAPPAPPASPAPPGPGPRDTPYPRHSR
jgi:hypothetical protein